MSDICFIHIDLDTISEIKACYGIEEENKEEREKKGDPAYMEGLSGFLELFEKYNTPPATLFAVGQDVLNSNHQKLLRMAIDSGFEIANHSFSHNFNLCLQSIDEIYNDIIKADSVITSSLGVKCSGFRAPGYNICQNLFSALEKAGYLYDSSLLPTYFGFVFRTIDKIISRRFKTDKQQFGRFVNGFLPNSPYMLPQTKLVEVPITTTPILRMPIHSTVVHSLGIEYLKRSLSALKKKNYPIVYLFHLVDLVDTRRLDIFKGIKSPPLFSKSLDEKTKCINDVFRYLTSEFTILRTDEWIQNNKNYSIER